ncbi:choice-of-anchor Q domain-containing protein [Micromonospora zingiberis]|uniref:choice-of-anchor Q domain-containing protein n=1 Tax=Micromonospora zingiberis TaxID=2053011 RepID=UPI00197E6565|nr:choice-of-anchor Q domain-containing protein [Micromonospora zingiberis]
MQLRPFAQLVVPVLAVCAVVFGTGSTAWAAASCEPPPTLKVPSSGTVVGTGTAASCTESALRTAVTRGGHVTFKCGDAAKIQVSRELSVTKTTVIDGGGKVTLDGRGKNRILVAEDRTTLSVRNLTFVNGAAEQSDSRKTGTGGAVAGRYQSRVEVIGSTFRNNTAGIGGGAVAVHTDSSLSITRSTFTGNSSWYGGAVYSLLSPLSVVNSTFTDNSTTTSGGLGDGGAIGTDGAKPIGQSGGVIQICGSTIRNNTGHGNGGGAYLWAYAPDKIIVERTTFSGNRVKPNGRGGNGAGGAARLSMGPDTGRNGSIIVRQSSLLSNTSDGNGGALYLDCFPTCAISNSTIHGNTAKDYGGAIFGDGHRSNNVTYAKNRAGGHGGALFGSKFVLNNTVFVANSAGNPWGQSMTCSSTGTGGRVVQWLVTSRDNSNKCVPGVTAANPRLAAPVANGGSTWNMMPAKNSPLLGAGAKCESRDQRGEKRSTARCDIGSVQRTAVAAASPSASPSTPSPTPSASGAPSVAAAPVTQLPPVEAAAGSASGSEPARPILPIALVGTGIIAVAAALFTLRAVNRSRAGVHRSGARTDEG